MSANVEKKDRIGTVRDKLTHANKVIKIGVGGAVGSVILLGGGWAARNIWEGRQSPTSTLTPTPTSTPDTRGATVDARTLDILNQIDKRLAVLRPTVTSTLGADVIARGAEITGSLFVIQGVPDKVDANNVDTAKGVFTNTIGLGSEMILAEPGVLKVGWDFPREQFRQAGEAIYHFDSGNQSVLQTPEGYVNVPEGAFAMFNGNAMTIEVPGNDSANFRLAIPGSENNHNIVIIRGLYPDGLTPADRNRIAHVTEYTPGTVLYDMYPRGGFVSQRHVEQIVQNAFTQDPNCGAEGCNVVTVYLLDLNTGAFAVFARLGPDQPWTPVARNW